MRGYTSPLPPAIAGYDAVVAAISGYGPSAVLSTDAIIRRVRAAAPQCRDTDEELTAHLVRIATGRTMAVQFDHRRVGWLAEIGRS
jgi:hypothetical protein